MKSSIRIIKRKPVEEENDSQTSVHETSVDRKPGETNREMVSTVKSWIAELQQRKRAEGRSFSSLPVIAIPEPKHIERPGQSGKQIRHFVHTIWQEVKF